MLVRNSCGVEGGVGVVTSFEGTEGRGWCGLAIADAVLISTEQLEARHPLRVPQPSGRVGFFHGGILAMQ